MNVIVEKNNSITTVILNRPQARNAVDRTTAEELAQAFTEFDRDKNASVGVFCGNNESFCAGADLKAIASGNTNRLEQEGDGPMGPSRMVLSKPVIAAISGYAVAGGMELALWCDLRIIEEDAIMGIFNRRWGIPLIDGGTVRLPRLIGLSRALDLALTGRSIGAQEALQMGLVNRVVVKGTVREEAEKLAQQLAQFPQICLRSDRLSMYEQYDLPFTEAIANEFRLGQRALEKEATKGAKKFVEK